MDNGMYNYGMPSPVMQGYNPYSYQNGAMQRVNNNLPHYEIIRVNGKPGVDAFQMGPNSSVILVDETAPIVWFVRTDGAGYKEAKPFDISLHTEKPPVDVNDLFDRITRLEGSVAGLIGKPRQKSCTKIVIQSLYLIMLRLQMQCLLQS